MLCWMGEWGLPALKSLLLDLHPGASLEEGMTPAKAHGGRLSLLRMHSYRQYDQRDSLPSPVFEYCPSLEHLIVGSQF
jgi:hypothetical protein